MTITNIKSIFDTYKKIESITNPEPKTQGVEVSGKKGFGSMLSDAIKEVDTLQKTADQKSEDLILGNGNVTPHDAMIALEKADVAFQLMNAVRSKIIRAYEEVIRAQV